MLLWLGLAIAVTLAGCGKAKYVPGPTWTLNKVLENQLDCSSFVIRVPEWSDFGRFGSDYYLLRKAEDGGKAVLMVVCEEDWMGKYASNSPDVAADTEGLVSSEKASSTLEVPVFEAAMYAMMADRLDALMFQLDEVRYTEGTYSEVTQYLFRRHEGVRFEGAYTFAEHEQGAHSVTYQGTGAAFHSEAGAVLVFALNMGEDDALDTLSKTVVDVCVSFRLREVADSESSPD